ncbi:uncharacterized protein LOC6575977 [Drosophila mojavensis]|uniref:Tes113, isoform A n=2 Tax=Drosophila mojavensis TaxID=7230 RepID=B4KJ61_DROMO|nr:uncharacterized protein LOC6575977 [Drosophila mojavensis]XP_015020394.1 uncharacterized protein LOC6575977 [Drosophila mojavensis]EDW11423.2 Tes113, isoform A [Drosophila mojavensis]KRG02687.1 Tes113, isoform B [Drosophila mojavensis]
MDVTSNSESTPRPFTNKPVNSQGNKLISMGRWVSVYNDMHGLIRRSIMPRYGRAAVEDKGQILLEPLLYQLTGRQDFNRMIFLLAPSSKQNFHRKLHCFERDTYKHLGSTCITLKELELLQQFEMLFKYELVYTDEYLHVKSLACDSSIIEQLVQSRRTALLNESEPDPQPKIKSLRQPKIPVRLRVSDVKRIKKIESGDTGEPVWKL